MYYENILYYYKNRVYMRLYFKEKPKGYVV